MKDKIIFFIFIMLTLALVFSCSKNTTSPDDFPENPLEWLSFPYAMEIDVSNSKEIEIRVITHDSLTAGELTINGYTAPLELSGWYFWWTYIPIFDSTFIPLNPGDSIMYTLKVDNKIYSGRLNLTYQPEIVWPDTFKIYEDYTFTWTIQEEPDLYFCVCDVMYHNDTEEMKTWTFHGPLNEYTLSLIHI